VPTLLRRNRYNTGMDSYLDRGLLSTGLFDRVGEYGSGD
jgi:hypothetical protein